jgi:hypothetical protein
MSSNENLMGAQVKLSGEVIEHLKFGKQEWVTVKLLNNHNVTISTKLCAEIITKSEELDNANKRSA